MLRIIGDSLLKMEAKNETFLVDTHAHLASSRFDGIAGDIVARARENGVTRIVSIACDTEDSATNISLAEQHDGVFATVGIHPLYVHEENRENSVDAIREMAQSNPVAAIGEIGLDYYHDPPSGYDWPAWKEEQRFYFEELLQLSVDLSLPVVIHQRNSTEDVLAILRSFPQVKAVLHCFSGTVEEAESFLELGHFLSFTGIITFPSAESVREAANIVPLDRLMVETDSPYLAPVPYRGKTCEPYMVRHTADRLAEVKGLNCKDLASITTINAQGFFEKLV